MNFESLDREEKGVPFFPYRPLFPYPNFTYPLTNFNKKVTIVLGDNMKSKEKQKKYTKVTLKSIIYSAFATIILFDIVIFYNLYFSRNETYAIDKIQEAGAMQTSSNAQLQFSNAENVDIDSIIQENTGTSTSEEFRQEINVLEYLTQYVTNDQLAKGESYVIQEGVKGTQKITYKKIYENGQIIGEEQISAVVEKPAFNKIVEIGSGAKTTSYTAKVGDIVYVTSDELTVRLEPNEDSEKVTKLKKDDALEIVKIQNEWYYINGNNQSPSWSGVEFLHNFLTKNKSVGPYGTEVGQSGVEIGDIAQLSFDGEKYGHTLVITKIESKFDLNRIYISSHTLDSFNKRISEYNFINIRFIHIEKVRVN